MKENSTDTECVSNGMILLYDPVTGKTFFISEEEFRRKMDIWNEVWKGRRT